MFCPLDDPSPLPQAYLRTAADAPQLAPLAQNLRADVAIVGAGYTGLSAALHLAERGASVAVLEARTIGEGGSGRAFGQVVPYAKNDHRDTLARFGPDAGERIVDALGHGPDLVWDLIARHGIECAAQRAGLLFGATSATGAAALEAKSAFWQARGAPVELLDARATQALVGSDFYQVALLDRRGGTLNPLAYVRGLGAAAMRAGAKIFERSRALSLERTTNGWTLRTAHGEVSARQVVLATGAYTDNLWPGLKHSIVPMRAYQLVSRPLSAQARRSILPAGHAITDTRRLYSGVRLLADGRVHVSVDGPAFDVEGRACTQQADARLRSLFPALGRIEWEESWTGWVDMTGDQYPHLHQPAPDLWVGIGLCGRGIAFATLLGRELASGLAGEAAHRLLLPVTPIAPIRARRFAAPLVGALMNWYRVLDRLEISAHARAQHNPVRA